MNDNKIYYEVVSVGVEPNMFAYAVKRHGLSGDGRRTRTIAVYEWESVAAMVCYTLNQYAGKEA